MSRCKLCGRDVPREGRPQHVKDCHKHDLYERQAIQQTEAEEEEQWKREQSPRCPGTP